MRMTAIITLEIPIIRLSELRPQTRDFLLGRCVIEHRTPSDVLREILDRAAQRSGELAAAASGEPLEPAAWPDSLHLGSAEC